LPNLSELSARVERARIEQDSELAELERLLSRVQEISEENPMLGTRGCRLGILYPEIYEMQVRAILRASKTASRPPHPEIMIPLVDYETELELMRELVVRIGKEEGMEIGVDYTVGTMIELPRACFVADRIARHADFFSFGTNDLTQTALGSLGTTSSRRLYPCISSVGSSTVARSRRSMRRGLVGSSGSLPGSGGRLIPASSSASVASTASTRRRLRSSTELGSTTSRALPSEFRSRGSPLHKRRSSTRVTRKVGDDGADRNTAALRQCQ
jgi:hypothetical protein